MNLIFKRKGSGRETLDKEFSSELNGDYIGI